MSLLMAGTAMAVVETPTEKVPEVGSTAMLLGVGVAGVWLAAKQRARRKPQIDANER